jgi:integrase
MSLYKRGNRWWYQFEVTHRGDTKPTRYQESAKTGDKVLAATRERNRRVELENPDFGIKAPVKKKPDVTLGQMLDALERNWAIKKPVSKRNKSNLKAARAAFDDRMLAKDLTDEAVEACQDKRKCEGYAAATINRALLILSSAYKLAMKRTAKKNSEFAKLEEFPDMTMIDESANVRQGFFEKAEFDAVHLHLPTDLKDFVLFAYITGWRKSEIAAVRWEHVVGNEILIPGAVTKNNQPRKVCVAGELVALMERRKAAQSYVVDGVSHFALHVFHREGLPVQEFRKAWASATKKAGSKKLFHDLRRSAIRNMIRSGVDESVAMDISGHRTRSMFKRYNITSGADLSKAMESVERYNEEQRKGVVAIAQGTH